MTLFAAGWISLPLPGYRDSTSSVFSVANLPLLKQAFYGDFRWLPEVAVQTRAIGLRPGITMRKPDELLTKADNLQRDADRLGLTFPPDVLYFMHTPVLHTYVPFHHYTFDFSHQITMSTLFPEYAFIRCLRENYGVLNWQVCLDKARHHSIIASGVTDLSDMQPLERWFASGEQLTLKDVMDDTYVCAPTFEFFLYRFCLEYLIAVALFRKLPLTDEQEVYLNHYQLTNNEQ